MKVCLTRRMSDREGSWHGKGGREGGRGDGGRGTGDEVQGQSSASERGKRGGVRVKMRGKEKADEGVSAVCLPTTFQAREEAVRPGRSK